MGTYRHDLSISNSYWEEVTLLERGTAKGSGHPGQPLPRISWHCHGFHEDTGSSVRGLAGLWDSGGPPAHSAGPVFTRPPISSQLSEGVCLPSYPSSSWLPVFPENSFYHSQLRYVHWPGLLLPHTCTPMPTCIHMHPLTPPCTQAHTLTLTHSTIALCIQTHISHTCTHMHIYTCVCTHMHVDTPMHNYTCSPTHR